MDDGVVDALGLVPSTYLVIFLGAHYLLFYTQIFHP